MKKRKFFFFCGLFFSVAVMSLVLPGPASALDSDLDGVSDSPVR